MYKAEIHIHLNIYEYLEGLIIQVTGNILTMTIGNI